jgi:hypothetical protein
LALGILAACSTASQPAATSEDSGPPGEAFTACQINGYASELDSGTCPQGTCRVQAFDTNGALLPCCTSIVSGPGLCLDATLPVSPDASEAAADATESGDAGDAMADAFEVGTDGEASVEGDAGDAAPPADAAEGG